MSNQSTPDQAYFDRNQLALAFARLAFEKGWPAGVKADPADPDWPVLYVDTPFGQVSWHLPAAELAPYVFRPYEGTWDGHDVEEKRRRLAALIADFAPF
jgi:hypothetical protein